MIPIFFHAYTQHIRSKRIVNAHEIGYETKRPKIVWNFSVGVTNKIQSTREARPMRLAIMELKD